MHKKLEDTLKKSIGIALVSLPLIFYGCGKKESGQTESRKEIKREDGGKYKNIEIKCGSNYVGIRSEKITDMLLNDYNWGYKEESRGQWGFDKEGRIFEHANLGGRNFDISLSLDAGLDKISMTPKIEGKGNELYFKTYIFALSSWFDDNKDLELFYGKVALWKKEDGKRRKINKNSFDEIDQEYKDKYWTTFWEPTKQKIHVLEVDWKMKGEDDWSPLIYIRSLQNPEKKYGLFSDKSSNQILYKVKRFGKYRE
jgi:hypothetical protein